MNKGQKYEKDIRNLLNQRNLLPSNLKRNDAGFIHNGTAYFVEIKNSEAPDYGQKKLNWNSTNGWQWSKTDIVTDLFDKEAILSHIDTKFIPRRYTLPVNSLTLEDKRYDQQECKKKKHPVE